MKCPSCGADIQLDATREFGFCNYCGCKVIQEKTVIEHRGTISIDGVANVDSILDRAFIFIEDGKYTQAVTYLEKVLDLNPRCSKAYLGKLLCQLKIKNISLIVSSAQKLLATFDNFVKAKRFATETELAEYEEIEKNVQKKIDEKANDFQSSINQANQKINELSQYLSDNKKKYNKVFVKQKAILILFIILALAFVFAMSGFLLLKTMIHH